MAAAATTKAAAAETRADKTGADAGGPGKLVTEKQAALREVTQLASQYKDASAKERPGIKARWDSAQANLDRLNRLLADARGANPTNDSTPGANPTDKRKPLSAFNK